MITAVLADHDVFQRAQVWHQPDVLEAAGDAVANAQPRRGTGDVGAIEQDAPGIDREHAGDQVENRGLTRAVWADKRGAHAAPDRKRQILDHAQAAEMLAHGFETKDGVGRAHPVRSFGNPTCSARVKPKRRRNCAPVTSPSGRSAMITMTAAAKAT